MKYLIICLVLVGCEYQSPYGGTNPQKDSLCLALIKSVPVKKDSWCVNDHCYYEYYYPTHRLTIGHYLAKDYVTKETWVYLLTAKDGTMIILESISGLSKNQISDSVKTILNDVCLKEPILR